MWSSEGGRYGCGVNRHYYKVKLLRAGRPLDLYLEAPVDVLQPLDDCRRAFLTHILIIDLPHTITNTESSFFGSQTPKRNVANKYPLYSHLLRQAKS